MKKCHESHWNRLKTCVLKFIIPHSLTKKMIYITLSALLGEFGSKFLNYV